jgi:hypothetical protein
VEVNAWRHRRFAEFSALCQSHLTLLAIFFAIQLREGHIITWGTIARAIIIIFFVTITVKQ